MNAYEEGDEVVLDGYFQDNPSPEDNGMGTRWERAFRFLANDVLQPHLHRWRLNMVTGAVKEERLSQTVSEFGMLNASYGGRKNRYVYAALSQPAWFLFNGMVRHDTLTGTEQVYRYEEGVFGSETAVAPRVGSTGEDDGYVVTITSDMNADASYAVVFDATDIAKGPVCKLRLPERISSGTHSTWAPGDSLRDWDVVDEAQTAIGL